MALGSAPQPPPTGFFAAVRRLLGVGAERLVGADVRSALERSSLFADAPPLVLDEIAGRFRSLRCSGGTFLCTEGERGGRMFLLDEGEVDIVVASDEGEPKVVDTLVGGQAFGMVSLASGSPRMSSCVARGDVLVHELSAEAWAELSDDASMVGSTFRRAVVRALADQLRHSNGQLVTAAATGDRAAVDAARSGM
jgi:CRP-like cAMP-binding protein